MSRCLLLFRCLECIGEEAGDVVPRSWRLEEQFENRQRRRIQQMGVPGKRMKDNGLVVESAHPKTVDRGEPLVWRFKEIPFDQRRCLLDAANGAGFD